MSSMMRGNFRMAIAGVKGSKWRSLLTMTGIIIGIVSVVTVVGLGEGVKHQIAQQIDHFGNNLITIRPGLLKEGDIPGVLGAGTSDILFGQNAAGGFNVQDVEAVQQTTDVQAVAPLGLVPGTVQADQNKLNGVVLATSAAMPQVLNQDLAYGSFWEPKDEDANVAVIGRKTAETLFKEQVPLGKTFTFRGQTFVVRGILDDFKHLPLSPTAEFDNAVFIPYKTAARLTQNNSHLYVILAKHNTDMSIDSVVAAITYNLRQAHGGQQDFTVLKPEETAASSSRVLDLLGRWIMAVAIIALLIGGVGIMNIMLVNVTERMHEIGVRKAVGATNRQILGQFMIEAIVISVIGGLIGIVASFAVIGLLYAYTDLKPLISWGAVGVATGVSLIVGVIFGTLPALKAARKDPIQALRHE